MNENWESLLDRASEIQEKIDRIDGALQDQFHTVDGFTYAAQQTWVKAINMEMALRRIELGTKVIGATLALIFMAALTHVFLHW